MEALQPKPGPKRKRRDLDEYCNCQPIATHEKLNPTQFGAKVDSAVQKEDVEQEIAVKEDVLETSERKPEVADQVRTCPSFER